MHACGPAQGCSEHVSHTDTDEGREFAHMLIKPYRKAELALKIRAAIDS